MAARETKLKRPSCEERVANLVGEACSRAADVATAYDSATVAIKNATAALQKAAVACDGLPYGQRQAAAAVISAGLAELATAESDARASERAAMVESDRLCLRWSGACARADLPDPFLEPGPDEPQPEDLAIRFNLAEEGVDAGLGARHPEYSQGPVKHQEWQLGRPVGERRCLLQVISPAGDYKGAHLFGLDVTGRRVAPSGAIALVGTKRSDVEGLGAVGYLLLRNAERAGYAPAGTFLIEKPPEKKSAKKGGGR